jgi:hypothetical protein
MEAPSVSPPDTTSIMQLDGILLLDYSGIIGCVEIIEEKHRLKERTSHLQIFSHFCQYTFYSSHLLTSI